MSYNKSNMVHTIRKYPLLTYFILANGISWLLWLPLLVDVQRSGNPNSSLVWLHYIGGFGPMLAAFVMTVFLYGKAGLHKLLKRQAGIGSPRLWLAVSIVLPFAFFISAVLAEGIMNGNWIALSQLMSTDKLPGFTFASFLLIEVIAFGLGEETGWRGFALPRLQDRLNPLGAAFVLTLPWAIWHIPTFFYNENMMTMGVGGAVGWFLSLITGSVILSWLFNNSRGSILPVALFHGLLDVVFVSRAVSGNLENYIGALVTIFAAGIMVAVWKSEKKVTSTDIE